MSAEIQSNWLGRNFNRIVLIGFSVAVLGALLAIFSGTSYRLEFWDRGVAFSILRYGAWIAVAGGLISVASVIASYVLHKSDFISHSAIAVFGIVIGVLAFYIPYSLQQVARTVPPIHDITTDFNNPPLFEAALALRKVTEAQNPAEYVREVTVRGGPLDVPQAQREAYPDIRTLGLPDVSSQALFGVALSAAEEMGWTIIAADESRGRIEAWDQTLWYGFIDDVVIRISSSGTGSLIDVRSVSRVGTSDVGKNAQRIRAYFDAVNTRL